MSDVKISDLTELTSADDDDVLPIVDTSAGETKKIQKSNLTPTLAEVLAEGNDAEQGVLGNVGAVTSGPADFSAVELVASLYLIAANGVSAVSGGTALIQGGGGNADPNGGASVQANGQGADGTPGVVNVYTAGSSGNAGEVLVQDATLGGLKFSQVVTTAASSPAGGGLTSPLVADTTNKKLYAWTGADYIQIGDWT